MTQEKAMQDDKLVQHYSGDKATGYDQRRAQTPRFKAEEAVFDQLFQRVRPDWVIDCPFGTGRWLNQYRQVPGPILGVDASEGMLAEAAKKCAEHGVEVDLKVGSIFDEKIFEGVTASGEGLLVCIRFLNWVSLDQALQAISSLSKSNADQMILGISLRPSHWPWWRSLLARLRLGLNTFREIVSRRPAPYVHEEKTFSSSLVALGWRIEAREFVYADHARENYFYLLTRTRS